MDPIEIEDDRMVVVTIGGISVARRALLAIFSAARNLLVVPHPKPSTTTVHLRRLLVIAHWKAVTGVAT
jgi:hypothetical protein